MELEPSTALAAALAVVEGQTGLAVCEQRLVVEGTTPLDPPTAATAEPACLPPQPSAWLMPA
jgi:hypothetical protein